MLLDRVCWSQEVTWKLLMNCLFSSSTADRHPHELLYQAPAEPVHKGGVWYTVSGHLLEIPPAFPEQGVLLMLRGLQSLLSPKMKQLYPDQFVLLLEPAGSCCNISHSSGHKFHPVAVQTVAACLLNSVSLSLTRQGLFLLVRQELLTCTVLPLRSYLQHGETKPIPAG